MTDRESSLHVKYVQACSEKNYLLDYIDKMNKKIMLFEKKEKKIHEITSSIYDYTYDPSTALCEWNLETVIKALDEVFKLNE